MRICIDIDGVVCELKTKNQTYADVKPLPGAVEKIKALRQCGHYIILQTARHMKTCNGNPSLVLAKQGKVTFDWLEKYNIEYDEITFGKPWADVYIDDNAYKFYRWSDILIDGSNLPTSSEKLKELENK